MIMVSMDEVSCFGRVPRNLHATAHALQSANTLAEGFLRIGLQSCAVILADSMSGLIKLIASCGSKRLILEMIRDVVHNNTLFVILKFEMRNEEAVMPLFLQCYYL